MAQKPQRQPTVWRNIKVRQDTYDMLVKYQAFFQLQKGEMVSLDDVINIGFSYVPQYEVSAKEMGAKP